MKNFVAKSCKTYAMEWVVYGLNYAKFSKFQQKCFLPARIESHDSFSVGAIAFKG